MMFYAGFGCLNKEERNVTPFIWLNRTNEILK